MKKILSTVALGFGLAGAPIISHAQNVFVTNFGTTTDPGTTVAGFNTTTGAPVVTFSGGDATSSIMFPQGIASDSAGNLYVTSLAPDNPMPGSSFSSILRIGTDGIHTVVTGALINPKGITFRPDGQLLVANGGVGSPVNNSFIGVANVTTGAYSNVFGGSGSTLAAPFGLAYDGSRYIYAGNIDNSITRFDTATNDTTGTRLTLTPGAGAPASIVAVNGLTFGPDGALYVADGSRGDIFRVTNPATSPTFTLFTSGLVGPEGLAFEPGTNNLFVANDDDTIRRIIPAGNVATGFIAGVLDPNFLVQEANGSGPVFLAFSPIPEPSTYVLFGVAGLALTVGLLRRRQMTLRA